MVKKGSSGSRSAPPTLTAELMGRLIAEAIEADGLTQTEFAARVGASLKHVNNVANGKAHAYQATLDYWAFILRRRWQIELVPIDEDDEDDLTSP